MSASTPSRRIDLWGLALLAPALLLLVGLFAVPAASSVAGAFTAKGGGATLEHVRTALGVYGGDIWFTAWVVTAAVAVIAVLAVGIAGYLTLGANLVAVRVLGWLYRWPLFVPMVCAAQMMRSFLARNGMLNNVLVAGGMPRSAAASMLDWRGILVTFVWKQLPFVTLMVAGAMAALDRSLIEAARDLGASRLRVLVGIVLPLVRGPLLVACVLTFVTLMSVLSVPVMLTADTPTMITVDMAYRITTFGDYGTADALGVVSYLLTMLAGWVYLRQASR